jgi:hypothetical protein
VWRLRISIFAYSCETPRRAASRWIDELEINPRFQAQAEALDAAIHHLGTADQNRKRKFLVDHYLHRAQYPLVLAFCVNYATTLRLLRSREHRVHNHAGVIHEPLQRIAVGIEILDGACRHPAVHRRFGDRRRDSHDEARVERARNQVIGTEREILFAIRHGHDVGLLGLRERRNCFDGGQFHFGIDGGRADIERTAKYKRKTQNIVDLVRIIRPTGGHHHVGPGLLREFGQDFRFRIGECQYERPIRHFFYHFRLQDPPCGQPQKNISARNHLA